MGLQKVIAGRALLVISGLPSPIDGSKDVVSDNLLLWTGSVMQNSRYLSGVGVPVFLLSPQGLGSPHTTEHPQNPLVSYAFPWLE